MSKELDELQKMALESGFGDPQDIVDPKKEEKKEEEKEEEFESDETKVSDEEEEKDQSDDEEDDSKSRKGIPYKVYNETRSQLREEKRLREEAEAELAKAKEVPPVDDNLIHETAKSMLPADSDEATVKATEFQLKKILELSNQNTAAAQKELTEMREEFARIKEEKEFNSEWSEFYEGSLKTAYKEISKTQLEDARKAMDELSHAPQFADKEFDYVYFKNKSIFDEILKSKPSKTFESRDTYVPREEESEEDYSKKSAREIPIEKLVKEVETMKKRADREENETGWNVMDNGKRV